jgi:hypothetical protein
MPVRAAHTSTIRSAREAPGHEPHDLGRGVIEPLCVVDDADQRLVLGDLSQQREGGQPDQEPVGCRTDAPAEDRRHRVALRDGEPIQAIQQGRTELMEAGVGQFHLGLRAHGPGDMPAGGSVGEVAQQGALAHARLAP